MSKYIDTGVPLGGKFSPNRERILNLKNRGKSWTEVIRVLQPEYEEDILPASLRSFGSKAYKLSSPPKPKVKRKKEAPKVGYIDLNPAISRPWTKQGLEELVA